MISNNIKQYSFGNKQDMGLIMLKLNDEKLERYFSEPGTASIHYFIARNEESLPAKIIQPLKVTTP